MESLPRAGVFMVLAALGMIAVGALPAWRWCKGNAASWPALGLGALAWVIGVALKLGWALPTNKWITEALHAAFPAPFGAWATSQRALRLLVAEPRSAARALTHGPLNHSAAHVRLRNRHSLVRAWRDRSRSAAHSAGSA